MEAALPEEAERVAEIQTPPSRVPELQVVQVKISEQAEQPVGHLTHVGELLINEKVKPLPSCATGCMVSMSEATVESPSS